MARCPDVFARQCRPGLLVALVLLAAVGPVAAEGENVLVILLDDIGVELLSVYGEGSNYPVTPTIDQLRSEGILFRNLWSAPSCTPTRTTLLTGRRGFRTGVFTVGPNIVLPLDERTLPEVFKDATLNPGLGYADAAEPETPWPRHTMTRIPGAG